MGKKAAQRTKRATAKGGRTAAAKDEPALLSNPFAAPAPPAAIAIFGASGDLTQRKLLPALYNLAAAGLLNESFAVVGVARAELSDSEFRRKIGEDVRTYCTHECDSRLLDWLQRRCYYVSGAFEDEATFAKLSKVLEQADTRHGTQGNRLYYLATAPRYFAPVVRALDEAGLAREDGEGSGKGRSARRVIVEKPFGSDLESARALNAELASVLREEQIYRIDHYLGKETVQNILVFRFGNGLFEPIWNRQYIDNVEITVAESLGVEGRGGYYDTAGALRDMVPNHLMQLLSLVTMEPPTSFDAEAVREEKAKVLRAVQPFTPERVLTHAVRGQYGAGYVDGENVPAYRSEPKVAPRSGTETYVALEMSVDNWRWADVPFYLRTGKRMKRRVSEIAIQFRRPPLLLFRRTGVEHLARNVLVIRVQPDEGITLSFGAKIPGPNVRMGNVAMDFRYEEHFGSTPSTGYETLLYDCLKGDATLFQRADMVESGWSIVEPLLAVWKALPPRDFPNYAAGTWGPRAGDELLERSGRRWRNPED
jgi:glucose-6-phosphate 1-dehydrogenase